MTLSHAFCGARIFDGQRFHDNAHLVVRDGRIIAIRDGSPPAGIRRIELDGGILSPGFIDVQVNGGGGVMLNDAPSPIAMARIAAAHRAFGTTALLPTLITDSADVTAKALAAAGQAAGQPGIIGLHLEGPHLDPARKGAHLEKFMRPLDGADVAAYIAAAPKVGRLLVTLAANQATVSQVRQLADAGVIVSIGHSDCSADEADAFFDAGARGATHLFNAMSGLSHREPGLVGAVLARSDAWAGIIADGQHIDPRAIAIALAAKSGPGRIFLVTDAMALVGSDADRFDLNGRTITRDASGYCPRLLLPDGTLAGSDIDMASSVRFLVEKVRIPPEDALRRATADPADFLRLGNERGRLAAGARADLVHLGDDLTVRRTWLGEEL
ncbi:N-acetylglucosamine-6-phosphate deacetylase [Mesorhizobium sp. YIM 152430]|uniref:N-acetylglucosamine-6-phosphate deacetylase n=1 Tax=Mesorhizobium sp. YIM 152430 TaxID=3031761 RepID=UPI0023DACC6B|nr:N-acetylglucosamine-6-phosphate deacetylase [Mesorhizobium sp. YIM 152430]MDF1598916.1 N-acetylglucosamine-6-phosphate deacetylase [Mesorhizobium sp. YIM 152430]